MSTPSCQKSYCRNCTILLRLFIIVITILSVSAADAQLKTPGNQADYIVIVPTEFKQAMESYCAWRHAQHMNVRLVDLHEIHQEFNQDTLTPSGTIRAFISYALQNWANPKPKYLLLVGDAEFIPSVRVPSYFAYNPEFKEDSVSIDEWYAVNSYESDTKPDLAIGRFPVRTVAQLEAITAKTMYFEDSLTRRYYANDMLLITDRTNAEDFEADADGFIASLMPAFYRWNVIRFGDTTSNGGTRRKLFDAINSSTLFFSTYIHGNPKQWSKYAYFTSADVDSLTANRRPFILTCCTCSQNFDVSTDSVIVERLLTLPDGGAVATFASTGLAMSTNERYILRDFYQRAFGGRYDRIGDIMLASKRDYPWYDGSSMQLDFDARRFTLLGDPALRLPRDLMTGVQREDIQTPVVWKLNQNYPNPFNPSTTLRYSVPVASRVHLAIFNMLGQQVAELVNADRAPGIYEVTWNADVPSGIYFYRIEAVGAGGTSHRFVDTKKMIYMR